MSGIGIAFLALMLVLPALRIPIGVAMLVTGIGGYVTMGQVALPALRRFNYSPGLATGALAAGGTLGILIPPSIVLAIYAILTEQNIAKLFTAAFVPGILATIGYMIVIAVVVRIDPASGPAGERQSWRGRVEALLGIWPIVVIFVVLLVFFPALSLWLVRLMG